MRVEGAKDGEKEASSRDGELLAFRYKKNKVHLNLLIYWTNDLLAVFAI